MVDTGAIKETEGERGKNRSAWCKERKEIMVCWERVEEGRRGHEEGDKASRGM